MGNKLCCEEENTDIRNYSNEEDKISPTINENITVYSNDKKKNINLDKYNYNPKSLDNNLENNKSNELFLDEIRNLKSSIFDNENDNENDNNNNYNYNNNYNNYNNNNNDEIIINNNNNNLHEISDRRKYNLDYNINKSGNNIENNMLKNKKSKKKKKNEKDNITDNKKVTINDPNCKIKPLSLNNISNNNNYNDKENDYYLINTSTYIGLKNSNSNLVFLKNQKDIISDKYELTPLLKTKIVSGYDKKMDNNAAKNLTPTKKNEKNDSNVSTNKNENSAKNVNKYEIVDNKNNNDNRILEIYINNQAKKISN
jgi:hypothetical protein